MTTILSLRDGCLLLNRDHIVRVERGHFGIMVGLADGWRYELSGKDAEAVLSAFQSAPMQAQREQPE